MTVSLRKGHPRIKNYVVKIPGTTVTAYLAVRDVEPDVWIYSLWTGEQGSSDEELIVTGHLGPFDGASKVTPDQIARIAFLLDVEYAPEPKAETENECCTCGAPVRSFEDFCGVGCWDEYDSLQSLRF